jgi:hypothetical protein
MKRGIIFVLSLTILISIGGCSGSGFPESPVGSYGSGSTSFKLGSNGSFWLEHVSSSEDHQHYIITGTYSSTTDSVDKENEISYGKIDLIITGFTLDGVLVNSLDFTTIHTGIDASSGQKLLGWWKYTNLVTYPGKMRLGFNLPSKGYRPEDVNTGRDWLIIGDPK